MAVGLLLLLGVVLAWDRRSRPGRYVFDATGYMLLDTATGQVRRMQSAPTGGYWVPMEPPNKNIFGDSIATK